MVNIPFLFELKIELLPLTCDTSEAGKGTDAGC